MSPQRPRSSSGRELTDEVKLILLFLETKYTIYNGTWKSSRDESLYSIAYVYWIFIWMYTEFKNVNSCII